MTQPTEPTEPTVEKREERTAEVLQRVAHEAAHRASAERDAARDLRNAATTHEQQAQQIEKGLCGMLNEALQGKEVRITGFLSAYEMVDLSDSATPFWERARLAARADGLAVKVLSVSTRSRAYEINEATDRAPRLPNLKKRIYIACERTDVRDFGDRGQRVELTLEDIKELVSVDGTPLLAPDVLSVFGEADMLGVREEAIRLVATQALQEVQAQERLRDQEREAAIQAQCERAIALKQRIIPRSTKPLQVGEVRTECSEWTTVPADGQSDLTSEARLGMRNELQGLGGGRMLRARGRYFQGEGRAASCWVDARLAHEIQGGSIARSIPQEGIVRIYGATSAAPASIVLVKNGERIKVQPATPEWDEVERILTALETLDAAKAEV